MLAAKPRPEVLVVEEDPDLGDALVDILRDEGVDSIAARDGRDALQRLRDGVRPALILFDLGLLARIGWEFRSLQRQKPELAGVPFAVLAATADGFPTSWLDAVGHLAKPLGLPALNTLHLLVERYCTLG